MTDKPDFSNYAKYIRDECKAGRLLALAKRAKVSRHDLYRVAKGEREVDEEMALLLAFVTEPQDDQWGLDPDAANFLDVPDINDAQMIERLQHAEIQGKLGVVAHISGIKGGKRALQEICNKGQNVKLDPVTRSLLLNVME